MHRSTPPPAQLPSCAQQEQMIQQSVQDSSPVRPPASMIRAMGPTVQVPSPGQIQAQPVPIPQIPMATSNTKTDTRSEEEQQSRTSSIIQDPYAVTLTTTPVGSSITAGTQSGQPQQTHQLQACVHEVFGASQGPPMIEISTGASVPSPAGSSEAGRLPQQQQQHEQAQPLSGVHRMPIPMPTPMPTISYTRVMGRLLEPSQFMPGLPYYVVADPHHYPNTPVAISQILAYGYEFDEGVTPPPGHNGPIPGPMPRSSVGREISAHDSPVPPPQGELLTLLQRYPIMWQGRLALKNDISISQFHFVCGNENVARESLPGNHSVPPDPPIRISKIMRLERTQLDGVARKLHTEAEYAMLLALPCGRNHVDVLQQGNNLRSGFITYLQLKQAAGIVDIHHPVSQLPAYVIHIFPSCDFANENLARIAPDLLNGVADIAHLLIVIATV